MPRQKQRRNVGAGRAVCDSTHREVRIPTLGAKNAPKMGHPRRQLYGEEDLVEGREQRTEEDSEDETAADEEEEKEAEHADPVVKLESLVGQEVAYDVASVERRDRDEIEDEEKKIDEDDEVEKKGDGKEGG